MWSILDICKIVGLSRKDPPEYFQIFFNLLCVLLRKSAGKDLEFLNLLQNFQQLSYEEKNGSDFKLNQIIT